MSENREYKSDVFSMLMEEKQYALDVYNALNESGIEDPELIEMVNLERGISLTVRNDASFIVDMSLNLYEHQSSHNPNMPLRSLIYFTNAIEEWLKTRKANLYGGGRIQLPVPHFVVFYNGMQTRPAVEVMRLSDSYVRQEEYPELELICTVYNLCCNEELLRSSYVLRGYMYFVDRVRECVEQGLKQGNKEDTKTDFDSDGSKLRCALERAIEDCIEQHILEDFFRKRAGDIRKMVLLDYTHEKQLELVRYEMEQKAAQELEQERKNTLREHEKQLELVRYEMEQKAAEERNKYEKLFADQVREIADLQQRLQALQGV